jgi:hypothetical protein
MILAHHMGEELLPMLVAGSTAAASVLLVVLRDHLSRIARSLRRESQRHRGCEEAPVE